MLHPRVSPGTSATALGLKTKVPGKQLSVMSYLQLTKVLGSTLLASHLGYIGFTKDLPSVPELVLKLQITRSANGAGITCVGLQAPC